MIPTRDTPYGNYADLDRAQAPDPDFDPDDEEYNPDAAYLAQLDDAYDAARDACIDFPD